MIRWQKSKRNYFRKWLKAIQRPPTKSPLWESAKSVWLVHSAFWHRFLFVPMMNKILIWFLLIENFSIAKQKPKRSLFELIIYLKIVQILNQIRIAQTFQDCWIVWEVYVQTKIAVAFELNELKHFEDLVYESHSNEHYHRFVCLECFKRFGSDRCCCGQTPRWTNGLTTRVCIH